MIIRKEDIVELWVEKLAFGGEGIARINGFVVFIKGAVPGDRILAKIVKKRKGYANAVIFEIIDPSPERKNASCPYSGYCGGCNYQHLEYEHQLKYKREQVIDSINRIGALRDIKVNEVIPSDNIFEYRNKMEFSFSDRRWILPEEYNDDEKNDGFALGLHVPGTFYKVIDIDACLLQHKTGNAILKSVKQYVEETKVPVYGLKSHKGFWRFLTLRYSEAFDQWMVNIVTSDNGYDLIKPLAERLHIQFDNIATVINNISRKKAAIALGEEEEIITGEGYIKENIGPYIFRISANSFFQTNTSGAEKLYEKVIEFAELDKSERVIDLYCGTGTIAVYLSKYAREIVGMEISENAVSDARLNCRLNNISNCSFIHGDIKDTISSLTFEPDVLIIDPPRTGMHKDVIGQIINMGIKKIVYVSCNPATMARDLGILAGKYEVSEIQPVDMFPHTYHIESVAKLVRKKD
jgi:23S rRNA (uracil1939-C5)-methyltransferase